MRSDGARRAYLRRKRSRLGAAKAITGTAHKLARIVSQLMRFGEAFVNQTEEAYTVEMPERLEKQLRRRARQLGFELTRMEPAEEAPPG